ncbi:N-(5'-phosphoribosyl)anthranilate isomerase, partial [Pseudomonas syringae pv. actinidiae]|nr:N-(5'-phosphoribosyl)anthranilate isomerase [Pseudomonas syringae pv. actinidiae]
DIAQACRTYRNARGVLLDTYVEGVPGGTGETFDWALIPDDLDKPVILAGGLTSANVAQAIAQVRPYAVDVSGGVEKSKGIKDREKILAFMSAVQGT